MGRGRDLAILKSTKKHFNIKKNQRKIIQKRKIAHKKFDNASEKLSYLEYTKLKGLVNSMMKFHSQNQTSNYLKISLLFNKKYQKIIK